MEIKKLNAFDKDEMFITYLLTLYEKETLLNTSYCREIQKTAKNCDECLTRHTCKILLLGKKLKTLLQYFIQNEKKLTDFKLMKELLVSSICALLN